jgi:hypothetical protein
MIGEGASPMTPIVLSSGQILIGSTGADPVAAAINSGAGILVGNGAGSITVSLAAIADHTLLANISGGALAPSSTTLTALIDNAIGSTQGDVLYRNATDWVVLAPGTMGQFLTSGGAAANVSWTSQVAPTGQALTEVDDTNVTMTLGGSPTTALLAATSMTLGWTGQLSVLRGGTGLAALTAHNLLIGNGTSALTLLAPSATSGIPLVSQGASADPAYGTAVVAGGGTGNTTFTAFSVLCAGTTATGAFQNVVGVGTSGQVLQSNGAGLLPTWATIPGATSAALTKTDDTNVTLTLGGAPTTALLTATSLTLGWTGQLGLTRGGTNASLTASNGGIVYSTASAMAILSGTATAGLALLSGSSTAPTWSVSPPITQIKTTTITATGVYSYSPTTGTQYAIFELQAPGGGSGGGDYSTPSGSATGGGGGGGYLSLLVSGSANLAAITGNIGTAGSGGAAGNHNGTSGGNVTLTINSGTQWIAGGGILSVGSGYGGAAVNYGGAGGTNTVGTNGTLIKNIPGQGGGFGFISAAAAAPYGSGYGGNSHLGLSVAPGAAAVGGQNYGSGATGAIATSTAVAGAAGGQAVIIVTEYISI